MNNSETPKPSPPVSLLGANVEIKEIFDRLQETKDVSWTELAIMTAKEYAESLRVPQYDQELRLAEAEIERWKDVARRLYLARGRRKDEVLRIIAEEAYRKLIAPNDQALPQGGAKKGNNET